MNDSMHSDTRDHPMAGRRARLGYMILAYSATALGVAGVFLPLLPATPFLLVAVWAAPKGSRRVHDWIYDQPQLARLLDDWQQQGAVPPAAKWLATAMLVVSLSFLAWREYHWGLVLGMSLLFGVIGIFLWTRPNPKP